jgi:hypothetical protein
VRAAVLADGNPASAGDQLITRTNNRTLWITATDWVKNGDRWTVSKVTCDRSLTVGHTGLAAPSGFGRLCRPVGRAGLRPHRAHCPESHADTMHGPATSEESRQQLRTMLTRSRIANHLYLQVVGDGDPHSLVWPKTVRPRMATDLLRQILAPTICPGRHHPAPRSSGPGRPAR